MVYHALLTLIMSTKNELVKKCIISQNNYDYLFNYLNMHPVCVVHKKCWFINSGMVIGMTRINNLNVVNMLLKQVNLPSCPTPSFTTIYPTVTSLPVPIPICLRWAVRMSKKCLNVFKKGRFFSTEG